jgi:hypothetical protein
MIQILPRRLTLPSIEGVSYLPEMIFALTRKNGMPLDITRNGRDPGPQAPAATLLHLPHTGGRLQSEITADPEAETIRGSAARAAARKVLSLHLLVPGKVKERKSFQRKIQAY